MKHVAFFRNTNLGRARSPTRLQLEAAFLDAGAATAQSFRTNGTLVFEADAAAVERITVAACARLHEVCSHCEPAFVRSLTQLKQLIAAGPFTGIRLADVYECCVTFLSTGAGRRVTVPQANARGDAGLIGKRGDAVFGLSRKLGASPGSPNAHLEKLLATPATTRNWNTIVRLVARHG